VREALLKAGRDDLIGWGGSCLIPPYMREHKKDEKPGKKPAAAGRKPADNKNARKTEPKTDRGARKTERREDRSRPAKHGGKPRGHR